MKTNKNLIIIILLLVVTFMGIGYAALSTVLTIQGTSKSEGSWDVKITNIAVSEGGIVGTAVSNSANVPVEGNGTTASFAATLNKPGDSVTYTVTVTNNGSITATLGTLTPSVSLNESHNGIIYTVVGIAQGDNLLKKSATATSKTFTIKAEFDPTATEIPTGDTEIEFSLTLLYNQCSNNCTTP